MHKYPKTTFAVIVSGIALSGCANQNAVFRQRSVSNDRATVLTMDAKQRNVIMVPDETDVPDTSAGAPANATSTNRRPSRAKGTGQWRVCAEASPDVFSALSTSAGADLGFGQSGASTEAKAKAAIAIAEAAGTIERTQTINLLRESMYRTCERYLSGAIEKPTFVVQAGRDWRAMIAILAIEQLTRSARPPSTILVAGGTTTSISDPGGAVPLLQAAKQEQYAAEDAAAKLAGDAAKDCSAEAADKKEECEKAKAAGAAGKAAAELRIARAKDNVADFRAAMKLGPEQIGANTTPGTSTPGGQAAPTSVSDMTKVAETVQAITLRALETDELQLFCIQRMAADSGKTGNSIDEGCSSLLSLSIGAKADALQVDVQRRQDALNAATDQLRRFLVDDAQAKTKWPELVRQSGMEATNPRQAAVAIADPVTVESAVTRYQALALEYRQIIAQLIGAQQ